MQWSKAACLVCFALSLKNPPSLHSVPFRPPFPPPPLLRWQIYGVDLDAGIFWRASSSRFRTLRRRPTAGRRLNGFLGLSLKERTILFLVILLDKTVSVG